MKKAILMICFVSSTTLAAFFDSGRNEIGGGLSFVYYFDTQLYGSQSSFYQISPFYNYYISNHFSIGPVVSIIGISGQYEIDIGLRAGIGKQLRESFFYFSPGITYAITDEDNGFVIPLIIGCKTLLVKHFGIDTQIYDTMVVPDGRDLVHGLGVAVGFFGLL